MMREEVRQALIAAGWTADRQIDVADWVRRFESQGFTINEPTLAAWREFGNLRVRRNSVDRPSSFLFDPIDASDGLVGRAKRLSDDYGENLSPLGMWSVQYPSYMAASGWVMAIGPGWDWELGRTLDDMLDLVAMGLRDIKCIRVTHPGAAPFPDPTKSP
ncbi:SUKH-3 domain-containing protein [Actinoplanes sp. RD1]|uniref:SUKH-3 domain-containing protein n=1 Tax=Actinoplanes sp. RD1 TaxID=3064538 RepID=UPI00274092A4|nr:SUKH-3 domain-containing protein [Actinoplanes sp. RD1]